jgi:alpha-ketoglutarate-dependent taurine dioxygenase
MIANSKMPVSCFALESKAGHPHPLPLVIEARPEAAEVPLNELLDWITDTRKWREDQLHCHGAILLRGFRALRSAQDFEAVAQRSAAELLDYAGGTTPRSAVSGKIVTSTDAPPHIVIGLHQEMSYLAPTPEYPDPTPDKVMFFCQTPPQSGGQTPIADMREVYKKLPGELIDRFEKKGGLVLTRKLPTRKRFGFEVTWTTAFGTSDRGEMERIAKHRGWTMEWTLDGGLQVTHRPSPVVKTHQVTGERIWFNQAHLLHKSFAPWRSAWLGPSLAQRLQARLLQPFIQGRFFYHTTHADGSAIRFSDLECIRRVVAEETVIFDWRAGDTLWIDNKLVAHGRRPFEPPRKILAALLADSPRKKSEAIPAADPAS